RLRPRSRTRPPRRRDARPLRQDDRASAFLVPRESPTGVGPGVRTIRSRDRPADGPLEHELGARPAERDADPVATADPARRDDYPARQATGLPPVAVEAEPDGLPSPRGGLGLDQGAAGPD